MKAIPSLILLLPPMYGVLIALNCVTAEIPNDQRLNDQRVSSVVSSFMNTNLVAEVYRREVEKGPKWLPDSRLPLSQKEAEAKARRYLEERLGPPPSVRCDNPKETWGLLTMRLCRFFYTDFWYYEVAMRPCMNGGLNWPPVRVFVTMDGNVSPLEGQKVTATNGEKPNSDQ